MALSPDALAGNKNKNKNDKADKPAKPAKDTVTKADTDRADVVSTIDNSEELGKLSDSVALVSVLGDPSDIDTAKIKQVSDDGKEEEITSRLPRAVGYRIKNIGTEPIPYFQFGLTDNFSHSDRLNHNDEYTEVTLAPGEEATLTVYETAVLIATPEFNGRFTGGDTPVSAHFAQSGNKEGAETTSENSTRVRFLVSVPNMTIRDLPVEEILTFDVEEKNGRNVYTNRKIKNGYEKFAPVANRSRKQVTRGASGSAKKTNKRNKNAAQFLAGTKLAAKK